MPAAYSEDLRRKAIDAVQRGEKKSQVCRFYQISRNTLDLWLKRLQETGSVRPSVLGAGGQVPKLKDREKFRQFLVQNKEKTQKQIAEMWGEGLTQQNVSYVLKKLGITRKKKLTAIRKKMKISEKNSKDD
ncbi:MAG: IS630 transposase-related protein [Cyanobacteriota bacterium]|nr:IS630 transposase-related protein [Cyanobacteriota bacterium]